jgi:hypothetical protein
MLKRFSLILQAKGSIGCFRERYRELEGVRVAFVEVLAQIIPNAIKFVLDIDQSFSANRQLFGECRQVG